MKYNIDYRSNKLTAARRGVGVLSRSLGDVKPRELFGNGRVDSNRVHQYFHREVALHGSGEALDDLSSVGAGKVEAHHLLGYSSQSHGLQVAVLNGALGHEELCRFVIGMVHFNIVSAITRKKQKIKSAWELHELTLKKKICNKNDKTF